MSFSRVWAVFLRYFYFFAKLDTLSEIFYWPFIDILLWGMTSFWIQSSQSQIPQVGITILIGVALWQVIWRSSYEIAVNILSEFWNRNLVNLFSTPLRLVDWMLGVSIMAILKLLTTLSFSALLIWLFFKLNIFIIGWAMLPAIALLTCSGWFMGYLCGGFLIYFGQRLQMLGFMTPFLFAPFSAIYYPVSALPPWGQAIAKCLPTTYVFEGVREVLYKGTFPAQYFLISFVLNIFYLTLSMVFFKWMFEKSRDKGLARLE